MPEGPKDDRGAAQAASPGAGATASAEAPEVGTTQAGAGDAAQGAASATGAAPAGAGTTDDSLIELGTTQQGQQPQQEGAQAGTGDEVSRLHQKLAFAQPRADALAQVRRDYPRLFDQSGRYLGAPAQAEVGAGQAQPAQQQQTQWTTPQQPVGQFDPNAAMRAAANDHVAQLLYGGDVLGAMQAALQFAGPGQQQQGQRPLDPATMQQMVDQRAAQIYQTMEQQREQYDRSLTALESELNAIPVVTDTGSRRQLGSEFLSEKVRLNGVPMTVEEALPRICQMAGTTNPVAALENHPHLGPKLREIRKQAMRVEVLRELQTAGIGAQLPSGGSAVMPPVVAPMDNIEAIGGAREPLRRG